MTGLAGAPLLPPGRRFVLCPAAQTPIHPQPLEMWGGQPGAGVVSLQAQGMAQPPSWGALWHLVRLLTGHNRLN